MVVTRTHKPAQPNTTEAQKREAKKMAAAADKEAYLRMFEWTMRNSRGTKTKKTDTTKV